ncbi:MAG: sugar phosphate isomerase/epimerase family protein [Fimbriiglobus sp.]
MSHALSRRQVLAAGTALLTTTTMSAQSSKPSTPPFGYCLNTSTVRNAEGKSRPLVELIKIASDAGYTAIEPWISEIQDYQKSGGTLPDLKKRFADAGLAVPDAIGFAEWIVADEARRKRGLETAKRDMDLVQQIGGLRVAAPPVGATGGTSKRDDPKASEPIIDLVAAADRYRQLFELGATMGITPIVEVWGFSKTLSRLGETVLVAAESGVKGAAVLPDIYHLYKGGSGFNGLKLLSPTSIGIFHVNDYPKIERGTIVDADRVYVGDGVAPTVEIVQTLIAIGYKGFLSVELFNREYWKQDPLTVAKTAREKLEAVVKKAMG